MNVLKSLDLSENEFEVYKGFLQNPDKTAAAMARLLSMDKSSTYRACEELEKKGLLISSPKKKGTTFKASNPQMLSTIFEDKIKDLKSEKNIVENLVANLQRKKSTRAIDVRIEYGIAAVQKVMLEALDCKSKLIRERFRNHAFFQDKGHVEFVRKNAKRRVRRKIKIRQLEYGVWFMNDFPEVMTRQKNYLKKVRLLPKKLDDPNSIRIWDNVVNLFSEDEEDLTLVMTIKDDLVASLMRNIFDLIWDLSKPLTEEMLREKRDRK